MVTTTQLKQLKSYVPEEFRQMVNAIAKKEGKSTSEFIQDVLTTHIKRHHGIQP